jgi:hypothetical protein
MLSQMSQLEQLYMWAYLVVRGDAEEFVASLPTSISHVNLGWPMSLRGRLPTFARLSDLVELAIVYQQISGTIPPAIGDLPKLGSLRLFGNRLTGTVPVLNNLSRLKSNGLPFQCEILDVSFLPDTNCVSSCSNLPECCSRGTTRSCTFAPEPTTTTTPATTTTTSPTTTRTIPATTATQPEMMMTTTTTTTTATGLTLPPPGSGVSSSSSSVSSSLSQSLSTSQTVDAAIPQTTPTSGDGTTIGIAVGVSAAVLFLIAAIALLLWRRKRASSPARSLSTGAPAAASNYGVLSLQPRADYDIGRL